MDHALLVGVLERVTDLCDELHPLARPEFASRGVFGDRFAANEFHCEVRLTGNTPAGQHQVRQVRLVDMGDAGMLELAQHVRFVPKSAQDLCRGKPGSDDLQRHRSLGMLLLSLIHEPHSAFANESHDAITAQPFG